MKINRAHRLFIALTLVCGFAALGAVHHERIEWCDVWIPQANQEKMPRVLLIGDSIAKGYYGGVANRLEGKASVARLTTSRSVCDPLFLAELRPVVEGYKWSIIHFNNGLHGTEYTEKEYREGILIALSYLQEKGQGAQVVGVLSTPTRPGAKLDGFEKRIAKRNEIVRFTCQEMLLPVNDLHKPMLGHPEYYRDTHHFKGEIIAQQAEQVAQTIRALLEKKKK